MNDIKEAVKQSLSMRHIVGGLIGAAMIGIFIYAASSTPVPVEQATTPTTEANAPTTQEATPVAPVPEVADNSAPPVIPHIYVLEDGGKYGYARPLSPADEQAGVGQHSLVMVRYLGEKSGTYTASMDVDGSVGRISCKLPCEFIKIQAIYDGQVIATQIMPAAGTLAQDVMMDAVLGYLKVSK